MVQGLVSTSFQQLVLDEVDSTNDEARRRALAGAAADCFVISARRQTCGRGRRGRVWHSPVGNVHMSVLISVAGLLPQAAQLGFAAAIALVDAVQKLLPNVKVQCKWPNDILLEDRKCAGMLLEAVHGDWLILGLGVDVVPLADETECLYPVTSLTEHGFSGDVQDVIQAFMAEFQPCLQDWRHRGFQALRQPWLDRARGLGAPVVVRLEQETLCGTFLGLDADGALLLAQPGEKVRPVHAGDVFFPAV